MTTTRTLEIRFRVLSISLTLLIALAAPAQQVGTARLSTGSVARSGSSTSIFAPAVTYGTGVLYPFFLTVADENGDGKLDLIITGGEKSYWVLLGNGDGTFQPAKQTNSVADVNADGIPDLIIGTCCAITGDNEAAVLLGTGNGVFGPPTFFDAGGQSGGPLYGGPLAVADLNADSKPDIVVVNYSNPDTGYLSTVGVLLGNGDGTFQPANVYASGADDNCLTIADVNSDAKPDILTCSLNAAAILLGNGDGTFQPYAAYAAGYCVGGIAVGDLTANGVSDVVVGNQGTTDYCSGENYAGVLLGNGNGTLQPEVDWDAGGPGFGANATVALADVNGDGKPDLMVANSGCPLDGPCGQGSIGVLLGNGDGTFKPESSFSSGGRYAYAMVAVDLNGDGRPDIVVTDLAYSTLAVLMNNTAVPPCTGKCVTSTSLVSNPNPSVSGQTIRFTATVASSGGAPLNGETVTFYNGMNVLGTASLFKGIASLTTSKLQPGIRTISAAYLGDANFTGSTSPALQQAVDTTSQSPTSTALTSSLNPSFYGQKVTWTATVTTSAKIAPTGKVNFKWANQSIGSAALNASGVATLTRSALGADAYPLFAMYGGDANNGPSTSTILNQVVTETTSAATLTSSPNPSTEGQPVTFTATIKSPTVAATGPVTFTAGKTVLGTAQLADGKATFTISTLPVGANPVTVNYSGDSNISGSSASVTETVQP